jgi:hypothetical protein
VPVHCSRVNKLEYDSRKGLSNLNVRILPSEGSQPRVKSEVVKNTGGEIEKESYVNTQLVPAA